MSDLPNRRRAEIVDVGPFSVKVGFLDGRPVEVFILSRGKSGTELESVLYALGVAVSKIMQGEEFTDEELFHEYPDTHLASAPGDWLSS